LIYSYQLKVDDCLTIKGAS